MFGKMPWGNEMRNLRREDKIENFTRNMADIIRRSMQKFMLENDDWKGTQGFSAIADWLKDGEKIRVDVSIARVKQVKDEWKVIE